MNEQEFTYQLDTLLAELRLLWDKKTVRVELIRKIYLLLGEYLKQEGGAKNE